MSNSRGALRDFENPSDGQPPTKSGISEKLAHRNFRWLTCQPQTMGQPRLIFHTSTPMDRSSYNLANNLPWFFPNVFDSASPTVTLSTGHSFVANPSYMDDSLDLKSRARLLAYDVFSMLFLERHGPYILKRPAFSMDRDGGDDSTRVRKQQVVESYVSFSRRYPCLTDQQHIMRWWYSAEDKQVRFHVERYDPPVELKVFMFEALSDYLSLYTSSYVQLRSSSNLGDNEQSLMYGVFALQKLQGGCRIPDLRGHLVSLTSKQFSKFPLTSVFSLYEPKKRQLKYIADPRKKMDDVIVIDDEDENEHVEVKKKPSSPSVTRRLVVLGGISFLNDACQHHYSVYPCLFEGKSKIGVMQWQKVTIREGGDLEAGDELYTTYGTKMEYDCPICIENGCLSKRRKEGG